MSRTALLALLAVLALPATASAQSPHTHEHSFSGAEGWAQVFDDPRRDAWQKPHEVITALALAPDAAVADIGAGTGYFAVRFAHMVPRGRVYAVDLEPDMVRYLGERAKKAGLANLTPVQGAAGDPRLPAPVDLAILVDVYTTSPTASPTSAPSRDRSSRAAGSQSSTSPWTRAAARRRVRASCRSR